jgi:hypothetical protein
MRRVSSERQMTLAQWNLTAWLSLSVFGWPAHCGGCPLRSIPIEPPNHDVRFTPKATSSLRTSEISRRAIRRPSAVPKSREIYSISSSAMLSKPDEMVRPSALAAFMLIVSSNLVGCSTGRSAGFLPMRIWAVRVPPCRYERIGGHEQR